MKKWLKITLISVSVFLFISGTLMTFLILPVIIKSKMLHPDHEAMYMLPQEFGMSYDNVTFTTSDGLELKGWYVEPINYTTPNSNITVIVLHGASHSKAFMLDHYGEGLYDQGFRLFFFDSRNRGESPDTDIGLTWGMEEKKDVKAAVDYVKAQPEVNASQVVLFAESQGAATILLYTAEYNDVACIIADSSWAYGDEMIKRALPLRSGFPWKVFGQITVALTERAYGYSFADISPAAVAFDIQVPTFIIHGKNDTDINQADAYTIFSALPGSIDKFIWRLDGRGHVEAYLDPYYFINVTQFIINNI
ncbi:MAG: alpha/beta fold hydrolase [Asgard group archaeon]|nr:alpha/beta fold hydrolase [Asgard group archaeon]